MAFNYHRLSSMYARSLAQNQNLEIVRDALPELDNLAGAVSATSDDVFESHNVVAERERAMTSAAQFDERLSASRAQMAASPDPEIRRMATSLDEVATLMRELMSDDALVFSAFEQGDIPQAAARMTVTNRRYSVLRLVLRKLDGRIDKRQHQTFAVQAAEANAMSGRQNILVGLLVLVSLGIGIYGWKLSKLIAERSQAEQALRASEERFQIASRATNDVIGDWDLATNEVWINEAWHTQLGYPQRAEMNIAVWSEGLHPEDAERIMNGAREAIDGSAQSWSDEYRFRRFDGTYGYFLDRRYIVRDETGKALHMIGAMTDLSHRRKAEADLRAVNSELEQLSRKNKLILDTAADGIFGLDIDGRPAFLNPAAERMIGWSLEEIAGKPMHEIVHQAKDGEPCPISDCLKLGAAASDATVHLAEDTFWRRDGTSFSVEYSATRIPSEEGGFAGSVVTFRDTTDRRAVQRMKDEFVSVVSHELRTPLTSIRGALGLLAGGLLTKSPEKGQRMLEIAVSNTDRLIRLINDILDIERIDSGIVTLNRKNCSVADLLGQAAEVMRPMADKAHIVIEVVPSAAHDVWADPDRIIQTLTNLLSNAIKFSPAGSTITLSAEPGADDVVFHVRDAGRGIPEDKLEAVFERFKQVDASDSRDKGGSGLGLAICHSIVHQHGGKIWVESIVGEGSVFSVSLPSPRSVPASIESSPGTKVIICDDEPEVREVLQTMLEERAYQVVAVESGEELVRAAKTFNPDVILLDLFMPGMNGWETLANLKSDEETAGIPVIIVSAIGREETDSPFDLAGWVDKPFDERSLVETLEHALSLGGRKPRIMIVEDDPDLARVIKESFERHGIKTFHAQSGTEAIELCRELTPDLLILDLVLPDLDGFGVVDWLRDQNHLRHVPLVVYSAAEPTPQEKERLKLGPTQFMTKSRVPPEEFEQRVLRLLEAVTSKTGGNARVA
jgi:PAS domain S-box-containing protein